MNRLEKIDKLYKMFYNLQLTFYFFFNLNINLKELEV
jgi:hypothetical protein